MSKNKEAAPPVDETPGTAPALAEGASMSDDEAQRIFQETLARRNGKETPAPQADAAPQAPSAPMEKVEEDDLPKEEIELSQKEIDNLTPEQLEDLRNHSYKKRWADTRKALNEKQAEIAALKSQLEKAPVKDSPSKADPKELVDLNTLSEEHKAILEDNPGLDQLIAQMAQNAAEKKLNQMLGEQQKVTETLTTAQKATKWKEGVEEKIPGGIELYSSAEFEDWENQNKATLTKKLGHYDTYDPERTIEEIRMYQKAKGIAIQKEKKAEATKAQLDDQGHAIRGRTVPKAAPTDPTDRDAAWSEALKYVKDRKKRMGVAY